MDSLSADGNLQTLLCGLPGLLWNWMSTTLGMSLSMLPCSEANLVARPSSGESWVFRQSKNCISGALVWETCTRLE